MRTKRKKASELTLKERINAPTPKFFRKLRKAGAVVGTIGGVLAGAGAILSGTGLGLPIGATIAAIGGLAKLVGGGMAAVGATSAVVASTVVNEEALNTDAAQAEPQPIGPQQPSGSEGNW